MSALRKSSGVTIVAMLLVATLAIAFWMLLLGPKREEAAKLGEEVESAEASLALHRSEVASAEEAREQFPADYQKLVVLGKAVPGGDETASLLVQLNGIAKRAKVKFQDLSLGSEGGGGETSEASAPGGAASLSATEAAASLLPLGATIGPAGLAVMPYSLTFEGDFFQIADFIKGLDGLVRTRTDGVTVEGRLITVDDFTLSSGEGAGKSYASLSASFNVTTYLTPPGEGPAAGSSPAAAGGISATPAAATGGAP